MDFISLFKKFVYRNTYCYNQDDYFSRHIYPHLTSGINTNHVIVLIDHYSQAYFKSYVVYIDADSYFTNQNLYMYFQKKDITVIFALSISHKSITRIKKNNYILQ